MYNYLTEISSLVNNSFDFFNHGICVKKYPSLARGEIACSTINNSQQGDMQKLHNFFFPILGIPLKSQMKYSKNIWVLFS